MQRTRLRGSSECYSGFRPLVECERRVAEARMRMGQCIANRPGTHIFVPGVGAGNGDLHRGLVMAKFFYFCFYSAIGCLVPFLNIHFVQIGMNGAEIGWLSSVAPLVALGANPLWAALADRWQRYRLLLAGCAASGG